MSLKDKIQDDLKQGMLSKDSVKVSALRLLLASIVLKEKEFRHQLIKSGKLSENDSFSFDDSQIMDVISGEAKKRKDSIVEYQKAQRMDLVSGEEQELSVLMGYLPKQMSEQELEQIIKEEISSNNISEIKQMGLLMQKVIARTKGSAQNSDISRIIKQLLSK